MTKPFKHHWGFIRACDMASFIALSQTSSAPSLNPCILVMGLKPSLMDDGTGLVVRVPSFTIYKQLCAFDKKDGALKLEITDSKHDTTVIVNNIANTRSEIRPSVVLNMLTAKFKSNEELLKLYGADKERLIHLSTSDDTYMAVEAVVTTSVRFKSAKPASYLPEIPNAKEYITISPEAFKSLRVDIATTYSGAEMRALGYSGLIREYKSRFELS